LVQQITRGSIRATTRVVALADLAQAWATTGGDERFVLAP